MIKRIPREQFLAWLSQYYDFAATGKSGATITASFKATFGMGHDDGELVSLSDDQEVLDVIEERYVQPASQ